MNQVLKNIYYDIKHPASFSTSKKLYIAVKKKYPEKDIQRWLQTQEVYTLHRPVRKKFPRNRYYVSNVNDLWQIDLSDVRKYSKYNDGFKFLLFIIDAFSKFAWVIPLKSKTSLEVSIALRKVFIDSKTTPIKIQSDKGGEFTGKPVSNLLKEYKIKFYTSQNPDVKCAIVERLQRTYKNKMFKYFTHKNTNRYINVLDKLTESYNMSVHSSLKMAPSNVNENNVLQVWRNLYPDLSQKVIKKPKFKIGDNIRISREPETFFKGYETQWSKEIFIVDSIQKRTIPVYKIKDLNGESITGTFYGHELQHVSLDKQSLFQIDKIIGSKGKGHSRQLLVRWLGYPSSFDSYILASSIKKI